MNTATYTGIVRGHSVLLEGAPPLPDGTRVLVTPLPERGTPACSGRHPRRAARDRRRRGGAGSGFGGGEKAAVARPDVLTEPDEKRFDRCRQSICSIPTPSATR